MAVGSRPMYAAWWLTLPARDLFWATLCLVPIFGAVLSVQPFPLGDKAFFEYVGWTMLHGGRLYVDVWDKKLPSIFLVNEALQGLFGQRYLLHILAQAAVNGVSVLLFATILRHNRIASWGPATFTFALVIGLSGYFNTCEQYALPCILLAYRLALKRSDIASGIALAVATTFWIPSVLLAIPLLVRAAGARSRLRLALALCLTLVSFAAVMWATFGARTMVELVSSWGLYSQHNAAEGQTGIRANLGIVSLLYSALIVSGAGALCALLLFVVRKPRNADESFALWWIGCALAAAMVTRQFYPHYFLAAIPALIYGIATFGFAWNVAQARAVLVLIAAFFILRCADATLIESKAAKRDAENARMLGATIRHALGSGAVIFSDAYAPEIYLASDALLPDRFAINEPVPAQKPFIQSHRPLHERKAAVVVTPALQGTNRRMYRARIRVCEGSFAEWHLYVSTSMVSKFKCE